MENIINIRCRAIIIYEGKLLVVKHSIKNDHYSLPGGHLEWGENIHDCLKREIKEELGIEPKFDKLLYVHNIIKDNIQYIEFFFEVTNTKEYFDTKDFTATHRDELVEICWIGKNADKKLLPQQVQDDLNNGTLLSDTVRFI